jgi:hypothetical protein
MILRRRQVFYRADLIGFQEAFVNADRVKLIAALRNVGLEHSRYFPSGLVGSGLLLVSRFPIESDGFIRYASNGDPYAPPHKHGDWWAGVEAGEWHLLTAEQSHIDNIFGSGAGWEWRVIAQGKQAGVLDAESKVPWSDHAARWLDLELRRPH